MEKRTFGLMSGMLLALVGCGGDSSSDDSAGLDVQIKTEVTDTGSISLTTTSYSMADTTIELNQKASGSIGWANHYYLFTAPQSGYISLRLKGKDSSEADLDMHISDLDGTSKHWSTLNGSSQELTVIELVAGHQYEIIIENVGDLDSENYTLTVAELNRDELGLEEKEYLAVINETETETCLRNGTSFTQSYTRSWPTIVNFKSGYFDSLEERFKMSSVSESAFKMAAEFSEKYTEDGVDGQFSSSITLGGAFTANNTSADLNFTRTYTDKFGDSTEECTSSSTGTMKFIL